MALLQLPKHLHPDFSIHNRKPIEAVEIDWTNPLTKDLLYFFIWQKGLPYDLVTKQFVTLSPSGIQLKHDSQGAYVEHSGRAQASSFSPWSDIGNSSFTVLSRFRQPLSSRQTLFCSRQANNVSQIELRLNANNFGVAEAGSICFYVKDSTGPGTAASSVINGDWQTVVGVKNDGDHQLYVDGSQEASSAKVNENLSGSPDFVFGGLPNTTTIEFTGDRSVDIGWSDAKTPRDISSLNDDLYQILKPATPQFYFVPTGAAGDTNVNANTEALTLTEQQASITLDVNINAATEALTITENQATVSLGVNVTANTENLTLTEQQADISFDVDIQATTESLTITEQQASISFDVDIQAAAEALTLTEYQAAISTDGATNVQANVESLALTGQQATIAYDINVQANTEALTLTEYQASVSIGTNVLASLAQLTLTENAADIGIDVNVNAAAESLTLTPNAATIAAGGTTLTSQDITNIVNAIFAHIVENGETFEEQLRLVRAEAAGKLSVSGTTVTIRDAADGKDRITATVDANGQRTSVSTDGS